MEQSEITVEFYRQMAFSAALLGGFAMTFLSVLITALDCSKKEVIRATGVMAITAVLLIVATLGATFLGIVVQQFGLSFIKFSDWPSNLLRTRWIVETSFFVGMFSLLVGLGISGFSKSRALGLVTSIPALIGLVLLLVIFTPTFM